MIFCIQVEAMVAQLGKNTPENKGGVHHSRQHRDLPQVCIIFSSVAAL